MSLGLKKGDKVVLLAGKDKAKSGKILEIINNRVVVEGVNIVKKHSRRRSEADKGGIKEIPAPLHISNVALYCNHCQKGVRFGVQVADKKTKTRICKKCKQAI